MGRHHWFRSCAVLALGLALATPALSGCASGGPGTRAAAGSASPDPTSSSSTLTTPTTPVPTTGGGSGDEENPGDMTDPQLPGIQKTLRGTPAAGVEVNCVLLTANDGVSYLLIGGDRQLITSGVPIEVTGQVQPDLMTTCQQGTPFTVATVRKI